MTPGELWQRGESILARFPSDPTYLNAHEPNHTEEDSAGRGVADIIHIRQRGLRLRGD